MAASSPATAIRNPVVEEETLLFYLGPTRVLGCDRYGEEEETEATSVFQNNGAKAQDYAIPGAMSAVMRKGILTVYGMMANPVMTDNNDMLSNISTYTISKFSPYPNPIGKGDTVVTTYPSALAAATKNETDKHGKDTLWLYFLKGDPGSAPSLNEIHQDGNKEPTVIQYTEPHIIGKSVLSVCINDDGHRIVFFQGKKGDDVFPIEYILTSGGTTADKHTIPGTQNSDYTYPLEGTPLASVIRTHQDGSKGIYLYFVNKAFALTRVTAKLENGEPRQWSNPAGVTISDGGKVSQNSQLAARESKKHVRVFFIKNGQNSYSSVLDKTSGN